MAEKPKRPLGPYMLWLNSARDLIKKDDPGIKVTEIAKKGGELWRGMKDKSEWENKAAKMKDEYTKAMQNFEKSGGGNPAAAELTLRVDMAEKPKRPFSAFILWFNSVREQIKKENPGIKVTELAMKGGELWREMKDKSEWEKKAAKMKDEYTKAMQDFEKNGGDKGGSGKGQKRSKAVKKPAKKSKKKESDDEYQSEEESD